MINDPKAHEEPSKPSSPLVNYVLASPPSPSPSSSSSSSSSSSAPPPERKAVVAKPEPKPSPKPEPKSSPKPQPKPEPKVEPKVEPKPEPKVEPKPEPKPEPKVEPKPEPKSSSPVSEVRSVSPLKKTAIPPALNKTLSTETVGTRGRTATNSSPNGPVSLAKPLISEVLERKRSMTLLDSTPPSSPSSSSSLPIASPSSSSSSSSKREKKKEKNKKKDEEEEEDKDKEKEVEEEELARPEPLAINEEKQKLVNEAIVMNKQVEIPPEMLKARGHVINEIVESELQYAWNLNVAIKVFPSLSLSLFPSLSLSLSFHQLISDNDEMELGLELGLDCSTF